MSATMQRKSPKWPQLFDEKRSLEARVREVFAPQGPLAAASAHFCRREGQVEFAAAVARALEKKESLIAEAGTGTGKTFAYLTPAILSGATVIISTAGKSLQDQLFQKDIPSRCTLSFVFGAAIRNSRVTGSPSRESKSTPFLMTIAASPGFLTASHFP